MATFDKMCRAYLSPIYQSGKLTPVDKNDKPVFQGRFNGGAISLTYDFKKITIRKQRFL